MTNDIENDIEDVSADVIAQEIENLRPEDRERIRKAAQLWRAQMLCLWKLCPKTACRRARACSADPDFCVERFEFLVSAEVRTAVETLIDAKVFGLSYDDACARALPGSMEAYNLWLRNLHDPRGAAANSQACEAD